jgi:hypothetical protein
VIVLASIARENVAFTGVPVATPLAAAAGEVDVTVGGAFAVVNDHEYALPRATPSEEETDAFNVAVYDVL